jgi:hypothetical protein
MERVPASGAVAAVQPSESLDVFVREALIELASFYEHLRGA